MKRLFNKNAGYKRIKYISNKHKSLSLKKDKERKELLFKWAKKIIQTFVILLFSILLFYLIINKFLKKSKNYTNNININNSNETQLQIEERNKIKEYLNLNLTYITRNYTIKEIPSNDLKKYRDYMDKAKLGIFLYKQNLIKIENPKVSIVISLYNREDYINATIRSVQNQNIPELEIIIIDDFSTDNSINYIKEMQKLDPRIVLYKNKKNMGTLYSKSIGVLNAKGQYILSLDSDDMLCSEDYLGLVYEEAIKGDYDYIQCDALYLSEIKKVIFKRTPNWVVLWSKLIKTKTYRKAIYKIGKEILNNNVVVLDDDIIAFNLFNGKKQKKLNIIGVCHFSHFGSHVFFHQFINKESTKRYCLNMINTIDAFYKMKNNHYGDYLVKYLYRGWGPCKKYSNLTEIQKLIDIYHMHKNKTKTKTN